MLRYIKMVILGVLLIGLVSIALANRGMVVLNTLPEGLARLPGMGQFSFSLEVPLFVVVFAGVGIGLIIGYIWEYLREHKHRAEVSRKQAEVRELNRKLKATQAERDKDKDEVLALLDQAS